MKKISEKTRRLLRKIYQGLGVSAISLIFQACYGPMMDQGNEARIFGKVHDKVTKDPISGIQVSVENATAPEYTDSEGTFLIIVPRQISYTITFDDVDDEKNGAYKSKTKNIDHAEIINKTLTVSLCEVDE